MLVNDQLLGQPDSGSHYLVLRELIFFDRGPIAQSRLERTPDKREVGSSNLPRPIRALKAGLQGTIGAVAQLGEHLLCTQEVIGSIPFTSTRNRVQG